jgi:hypothetical protein
MSLIKVSVSSLYQLQARDGALTGRKVRRVFDRRSWIGVFTGVNVEELAIFASFTVA